MKEKTRVRVTLIGAFKEVVVLRIKKGIKLPIIPEDFVCTDRKPRLDFSKSSATALSKIKQSQKSAGPSETKRAETATILQH